MDKKSRSDAQFSSSLGFLLSAAGAAIGLGNIWKFPHEAGQGGGGIFLVFYLLLTLLLGCPLLLAKMALGRRTQGGTYKAYRNSGPWKRLGALTTLIPFTVLSFYSVVAGWVLLYGMKALTGGVCVATNPSALFVQVTTSVSQNLIATAIVLVLTAVIVTAGVQAGLERANRIMMPLFLILLVLLIGYALTLENAMEGIKFYLLPKFEYLTLKTLYKALSTSFLSLALGGGVFIAYGAYLDENKNLPKMALLVVLSDTLIAFLAGLLIFPLVFHQHITPISGPSLVFITLPSVFQSLGVGSYGISLLFFILLFFACITSTISMLEIPVSYLTEAYQISRKKAVMIVTPAIGLLSMPSILSAKADSCFNKFLLDKDFMSLLIFSAVDIGMPLVALLFALHIRSRWKQEKLAEEIEKGSHYSPSTIKFFYYVIAYLAPFLIGLILLVNLFGHWA